MKQKKNWLLGGLLAVMLTTTESVGDFQKAVEAYNAGDYATAVAELTPLAVDGDPAAQLSLSDIYRLGQGVPQDDSQAAQ